MAAATSSNSQQLLPDVQQAALPPSSDGVLSARGLLDEPTPRWNIRSKVMLASSAMVLIISLFGVAVAVAPSAEAVCHRLNLTTPEGKLCVENFEGPICPAQGDKCTVLSQASYDIQGTECVIIGCLLFFIWYYEDPRRHPIQFCADNSKSIMLALTVRARHKLVWRLCAGCPNTTPEKPRYP